MKNTISVPIWQKMHFLNLCSSCQNEFIGIIVRATVFTALFLPSNRKDQFVTDFGIMLGPSSFYNEIENFNYSQWKCNSSFQLAKKQLKDAN